MEGQATATRIYVGGLGERVTEEDLRKTFCNLGSVQTVDIIRTKGRSFAYINFLPSSQNSLAKLFSMYNGCSWKGGKLKLEKAKEYFVDRLNREWAEDAELENGEHVNHINVDGDMAVSAEPKSAFDVEKAQICIFFPKLRKVKSLPLRGSGKHKYSFQRVQVPPLPVHICDCCLEPSEPIRTPKEKFQSTDIQDAGINEKEINMMSSVMNRLLHRGACPEAQHSQFLKEIEVQDSGIQEDSVTEEEINLMESVMKKVLNKSSSSRTEQQKVAQDYPQQSNSISGLPVDKVEIDDGSDDDDDIKINTVSGHDDDEPFFENWELQTNLVNEQAATSSELLSFDALATQSKWEIQEKNDKSSNKKRKALSHESTEKDLASPRPKKKVRFQAQTNASEIQLEDPNSFTEPKPEKSSEKRIWSQKSAWKELVGDGSSSLFSVSHVTSSDVTNNEERPKPNIEKSSNREEHKKVDNVLHEKSPKVRDEPLKSQLPEVSTITDKSTKGNSWLQKSSWTQLVGGQSSSSFSISQIVPTISMLEKQDLRTPINFGTIFKQPQTSGTSFGGSKVSKPSSLAGSFKKKDAQVSFSRDIKPSKASSDDHLSEEKTTEKKSSLEPMQASSSLPVIGLGVRISETCPFMRNSDSLKRNNTK